MKNKKNYVMTSVANLTQSGLLAVLLQRRELQSDRVGSASSTSRTSAWAFRSTPYWLLGPARGSIAGRSVDRGLRRNRSAPHTNLLPTANRHAHQIRHLHRASATDSQRSADRASRMGRAKWRVPDVRFLRSAPCGTIRKYHANGIQRVDRCCSSHARTSITLKRHRGCWITFRCVCGRKVDGAY